MGRTQEEEMCVRATSEMQRLGPQGKNETRRRREKEDMVKMIEDSPQV